MWPSMSQDSERCPLFLLFPLHWTLDPFGVEMGNRDGEIEMKGGGGL